MPLAAHFQPEWWKLLPYGVITLFANRFLARLMNKEDFRLRDLPGTIIMSTACALVAVAMSLASEATKKANESFLEHQGNSQKLVLFQYSAYNDYKAVDAVTSKYSQFTSVLFILFLVVVFVLAVFLIIYRAVLLLNVQGDFTKIKQDPDKLRFFTSICGFITGLLGGVSDVLVGSTITYLKALNEHGGTELVFSTPLVYVLTICGAILWLLYNYYLAANLHYCTASAFVTVEQVTEIVVYQLAAMVLFQWYNHIGTTGSILLVIGGLIVLLILSMFFCTRTNPDQAYAANMQAVETPQNQAKDEEQPLVSSDTKADPGSSTAKNSAVRASGEEATREPASQGSTGTSSAAEELPESHPEVVCCNCFGKQCGGQACGKTGCHCNPTGCGGKPAECGCVTGKFFTGARRGNRKSS